MNLRTSGRNTEGIEREERKGGQCYNHILIKMYLIKEKYVKTTDYIFSKYKWKSI